MLCEYSHNNHLHFEIRTNTVAYTSSSGWFVGTAIDPIANYFPSYGRSDIYFDDDPYARCEGSSEAIYIERDGMQFDVRWIIEMTDEEIEYYNITDEDIAFAINALG